MWNLSLTGIDIEYFGGPSVSLFYISDVSVRDVISSMRMLKRRLNFAPYNFQKPTFPNTIGILILYIGSDWMRCYLFDEHYGE